MTAPTFVITGASDGIGAAAARLLHSSLPDARLVLVGRNPAKTAAVAAELGAEHHTADFSRLDEVRDLAAELQGLERIDVLANNAGGMFDGPICTEDGFEQTWQINYLAPYLLTNLLLPTLLDSRASVVSTSSIASVLFSRFNPEDPDTQGDFSASRAYGNAKLGNVMFTTELHARYHDRGLNTVAFHPGVIATNFGAESSGIVHFGYHSAVSRLFRNAQQGGHNLAHFIAGTPGIHWESGCYYNDKRRPGIQKPVGRDAALASRVFEDTARVLGVTWG
ncbi:MAG: SDR family NAD(P)-dependent oxidoreductase [Corynebacterium sp.]|uniref:SDR family NAD(P)-dependent oxidoreductase n=1 Tax=Corynebacterium sp. TaxID=1720 RepID=UPI0026DFB220|nr:SDR family NAD(P)-dependent oxidoreductase [Corynebacterium sp.]MDO5671014.1 SDR family NAD(P)-dependent oxidoreductase [Corynebacterium sp.]